VSITELIYNDFITESGNSLGFISYMYKCLSSHDTQTHKDP